MYCRLRSGEEYWSAKVMEELLASESEPLQRSNHGESKVDWAAASVSWAVIRVGGGDGEGDEKD